MQCTMYVAIAAVGHLYYVVQGSIQVQTEQKSWTSGGFFGLSNECRKWYGKLCVRGIPFHRWRAVKCNHNSDVCYRIWCARICIEIEREIHRTMIENKNHKSTRTRGWIHIARHNFVLPLGIWYLPIETLKRWCQCMPSTANIKSITLRCCVYYSLLITGFIMADFIF